MHGMQISTTSRLYMGLAIHGIGCAFVCVLAIFHVFSLKFKLLSLQGRPDLETD